MQSAFLTPVWIESLNLPLKYKPFLVLEEIRYYSELLGREIVVPKGYRTDFASIPWWARTIFPPSGEYRNAAIIHDWLCDQEPKDCNDHQAAMVLREAMRVINVREWKVKTIYRAVRIGGPRFHKGAL